MQCGASCAAAHLTSKRVRPPSSCDTSPMATTSSTKAPAWRPRRNGSSPSQVTIAPRSAAIPSAYRCCGRRSAEGWSAVIPNAAAQILAWDPVSFEPLHCWALVEHADGSAAHRGPGAETRKWQAEPGALEFPEARRGLSREPGLRLAGRPSIAELSHALGDTHRRALPVVRTGAERRSTCATRGLGARPKITLGPRNRLPRSRANLATEVRPTAI